MKRCLSVARVFNPCRSARLGVVLSTFVCLSVLAAEKEQPLIAEANHKLVYRTESNGDRVPDFSYAGYRAGEVAISDVPIRVVVSPIAGDNTARVQAAIDYIASLPLENRGAVLLAPGRFEIHGGLRISASGIVLRGSGIGKDGTLLVAAGHD